MTKLPPTTTAWILSLAGIGLLLLSAALHWQMLLVVFDQKHVAPGGGEYMVALFGGVPALLAGSLLLGVASLVTGLRSLFAVLPFVLGLFGILAWLAGIALG